MVSSSRVKNSFREFVGISKMKLNVIKIGGNIVDNPDVLDQFIEVFSNLEGPKILVHGGGKIATKISASLGIQSQMIEGRRVTDSETLEVVTMVYAGLVNKKIVSKIQSKGLNAIGLSGADGDAIRSHKRIGSSVDYGFVGDVDEVNAPFLSGLINNNVIPIMAPITHDGKGQLLNTNADTIASEVAVGLSKNYEVELTYCFELPGVMRDIKDPSTIFSSINLEKYNLLKEEGVIVEGMIPKMDNCFNAISKGVSSVRICHALNLTSELGTTLKK